MKLKKMVKYLKRITEEQSSIYTEKELNYMKHQLDVIESELKRLEHRDYKGFGKK
jgi:ubiquinone biosynthesis protein UbiJ